jgi:hypothetical protein
VLAVGNEPRQPLARERDCVRPRDADGVEAVLARDLREGGLEGGGLVQKSRSA